MPGSSWEGFPSVAPALFLSAGNMKFRVLRGEDSKISFTATQMALVFRPASKLSMWFGLVRATVAALFPRLQSSPWRWPLCEPLYCAQMAASLVAHRVAFL